MCISVYVCAPVCACEHMHECALCVSVHVCVHVCVCVHSSVYVLMCMRGPACAQGAQKEALGVFLSLSVYLFWTLELTSQHALETLLC